MNQKANSIIRVSILFMFMAGCSTDGNEDTSILEDGIRIEVEAPQLNGWGTEENSYTRSGAAISVQQKGEDGLDMKVDLLSDTAGTFTDKATTRWTNMDDNTVFRVVAYACTSAATITTSNYKGYGDYKLLTNGTVQTVKSLTLPLGTYTFICYSYGNSTTLSAFSNTTTSITATNGDNFMTCVKPNITIDNIGSTYTLSNITFTHHCARYRVSAAAQSGRMANITACAATLTLPANSATYSFTNNAFTANTTAETIALVWKNLDAMTVHSNYVYLLPQSGKNLTVKLNLTIGGKGFNNKSIALTGITLNANGTYRSIVSFTTTEGYIVGGSMWANGNLYYNGVFSIYGAMTEFSSSRGQDFWYWDALYPSSAFGNSATTWAQERDPCRKVAPANNWRLPKLSEYDALLKGAKHASIDGKNGIQVDNILFFPVTGYYPPDDIYSTPERGLYWAQDRQTANGNMFDFQYPLYVTLNASNNAKNAMTIRCVRNI